MTIWQRLRLLFMPIKTVRVIDGDVLVFQCDCFLCDDTRDRLEQELGKYFPRQRVLVLAPGLTLTGAIFTGSLKKVERVASGRTIAETEVNSVSPRVLQNDAYPCRKWL